MRKTIALFLLCLFVGSFMVGCGGSSGMSSGMVDNWGDRRRMIAQSWEIQRMQFVDDFFQFWLLDRNTHLSEWHARAGY